MKIKKYKVCMRLGPIYEKCQTPKFVRRAEKPVRSGKRRGGGRTASDFGGQLMEKQKVRMTYGLKERQFASVVRASTGKSGVNSAELLFRKLESRLDNVVYRAGLAATRLQARQMVTHGHIMVNRRRMSVPSHTLDEKDVVSVNPRSADKGLFKASAEDRGESSIPAWLDLKKDKNEAEVKGLPIFDSAALHFDLGRVVEFYSR